MKSLLPILIGLALIGSYHQPDKAPDPGSDRRDSSAEVVAM
jgi:hypothetical protein